MTVPLDAAARGYPAPVGPRGARDRPVTHPGEDTRDRPVPSATADPGACVSALTGAREQVRTLAVALGVPGA